MDNPGPGGNPVSLLAAGLTSGALSIDGSLENSLGALGSLGPGLSVSVAATYSDSGDSTGARSTDNATPPMHFLTPHVEISMADNETYSPGQSNNNQGIDVFACSFCYVFMFFLIKIPSIVNMHCYLTCPCSAKVICSMFECSLKMIGSFCYYIILLEISS